ncbi:unnamed protein product [Caenorhabditis bovis]|uniref:RING-type domain-containing protein n=1 Tax=Caenorhabditis bovis TaxID=2654633 RepID=A0A8S1EGV6_9PELO|nr:unnamed protein product [Caenorhabditis bovis]
MGNKQSKNDDYQNCTWVSFIDSIKEMNRNYRNVLVDNDEYLCFALRKVDMNFEYNVNWKDKIKIICCRVNCKTNMFYSGRTLDLREFYNAYNLHKVLMTKKTVTDPTTTSQYILGQSSDIEGNCVICMDIPNQVLLPCLHSFCLSCIAAEFEYRQKHFSCPICKTPIENPIESSWEVPDAPTDTEVTEYLRKIAQSLK